MKKQLKWIIAALAVTAVATPALAEDGIKFYGSVRLKTNYVVTADKADQTTDDSVLTLQTNSRFGANVTTGAIGGKVEMGFKNPETNGGTTLKDGFGMYTRLLYGTYKTEGGSTFLVGQDYLPYWTSYSLVYKDDDGLNGFGELYEGRTPQLKFTSASGLYLFAAENYATYSGNGVGAPVSATTGDTTKALLPKLGVGFKQTNGALTINTGVAYQQYDQFTGNDKDIIVSYLGYFEAAVKQESFGLQGKVHYGQNLKEFGFARDRAYTVQANNQCEDAESYGGVVQADIGMASAGFSYTIEDLRIAGANGKADRDVVAWVNYKIVPVKGFTIVPELAYYDYNVPGGFDFDGADEVAATIKWQMDF